MTTSALPKVAIITPVYNGGPWLDETMACVQAQTYPNLVHIVLDNASTDETPDVIARYLDRKVPVIAFRNDTVLGQRENWNAAFEKAPRDAEFVRLLCGDDTITPDCIEKCVALAAEDPSINQVFTLQIAGDKLDVFDWPDTRVMKGDDLIRAVLRSQLSFFATHSMLRHADVLTRKTFFVDIPGFDFESALYLATRGNVGLIHEPLSWTRLHDGSVTSTVMLRYNTHFVTRLRCLYTYGPAVLDRAEFEDIARRFKRHYVRRVMRWKRKNGEDNVKAHVAALRAHGHDIGPAQRMDAIFDWLLIRLGLRQHWSGWAV